MDRALALTLAAGAFSLHAAGACPTIYVGDSGELVAAAHTLGIPHPSGYPLYVLLGKLWTLIVPIGSIAYRMSLFSAAAAAVAVGIVFLAGRALGAARATAAAATLAFAASPSFWAEANVQRTYTLNALFVALATLLAIGWYRRLRDEPEATGGRDRRFVAIAFVVGLGAANHTFVAVWGLAFLLGVLAADPALFRRGRTVLAATGVAMGGLSVYAYLPLRSRQEPRLDWGDPETLGAFVRVVARRDFWERRWLEGPRDLVPIATDFLASFSRELTIAGALLAVLGLIVGRRRGAPVALLAVVALANLAALAAHGSRSDLFLWHRYYIPAYLSAALLAALGLDWMVEWARARAPRLATALAALALAGASTLAPLRFADHDRSRYRIAEAYSRELLATLPPGAHLAASDDNILFVLLYLQLVEGARPDVDLILQGVGGDLPPLRFDPDREPLFFTHHPNWRHPELDVVPVGLAYRVVRAGSPLPPVRIPARPRLPGEDDHRVPKDYLTRNLVGEYHFMWGVTWERVDRARALAELEEAARAAPENDVLHYNLGLVFERMGLEERALAAFERSAAINSRPIPGPARARASDRAQALRHRLGTGG